MSKVSLFKSLKADSDRSFKAGSGVGGTLAVAFGGSISIVIARIVRISRPRYPCRLKACDLPYTRRQTLIDARVAIGTLHGGAFVGSFHLGARGHDRNGADQLHLPVAQIEPGQRRPCAFASGQAAASWCSPGRSSRCRCSRPTAACPWWRRRPRAGPGATALRGPRPAAWRRAFSRAAAGFQPVQNAGTDRPITTPSAGQWRVSAVRELDDHLVALRTGY